MGYTLDIQSSGCYIRSNQYLQLGFTEFFEYISALKLCKLSMKLISHIATSGKLHSYTRHPAPSGAENHSQIWRIPIDELA